ncbi:MAG TPA: FAD:protein FMN transferase [Firmicutes bacterium]|jgi:thiamine biosynthesis lipoprotein|nr:FAD:protein FMN transferase [Bacillota bacterium]
MRFSLKTVTILALMPLILLNILGCSGEEKYEKTIFLMDTKVDITLFGQDMNNKQYASLADEIEEEMKQLEGVFSSHVVGSDICRINDAAGQRPVKVRPETIFVMQKALEVAEITGGAFDPTVAPLLELWGFGADNTGVPSEKEIYETMQLVNYRAVEIDEDSSTIFLPEPGMKIDLGGIAKGYIVDQGLKIAENSSASALFVNAGGDISVAGNKPSGENWRIAIQDPFDSQKLIAVLKVKEGSIATSGGYQRFFEVDGKRYHHILDPATGYPASEVASVSILAPDTITADALSTAVFVLGLDDGMELLESLDGVEGVIIDGQGKIFASSGLMDDLEIVE